MSKPAPTRGEGTTQTVLSVITTCLNEEENIDPLVRRTLATFEAARIAGELVIVDDGSTDQTWDRIHACMQRDPRVLGVRHDTNRGMERGWRSALAASRGGLICLIDADLQNAPEDVARLYESYTQGSADIVQGSRCPITPPKIRYGLSRGLNLLLNATFGMNLKDNKSGFLLCRREVLVAVLQHRFSYKCFQCFIAPAANAKGLSIAQIDTVFYPRAGGESFLNNMPVRAIGRTLWELTKARIEFGCGRKVSTGSAEALTWNPRTAPAGGRGSGPC